MGRCRIHRPGALLSCRGQSYCRHNRYKARTIGTGCGLAAPPLFGLRASGQGLFPTLMAKGVPIIASWPTRTHLIISLFSGFAWLIGGLLLITPMRRNPEWRRWYLINIAAVLFAIVGSFGRGGGPTGRLGSTSCGRYRFCLVRRTVDQAYSGQQEKHRACRLSRPHKQAHTALGYLPPAEFERNYKETVPRQFRL